MPAFLARRYDDPATVEARDGEPVAFVRHAQQDRRYVVRSVLAHWWETGPWWDSTEPTASLPGGGVPDDERELWRVEAVATGTRYPRSGADCRAVGGEADVVVVELRRSWATGGWTVAAVLD